MDTSSIHETAQAKEAWERIVRYVERVPTLPQCVFALQREAANPKATAASIGRIIARDQALTSRVLRVVNSAHYGLGRRVKNVAEAVALLGFKKVRALVYTLSLGDIFAARPLPGGLNRADLWRHAVATAAAARELASLAHGIEPETAFTAGILHDIGKVVLEQYAHAEFAPVVQRAQRKPAPLIEVEIEVLGVSHAHVGRLLLTRWHFPDDLVAAVARHHSPSSLSQHYPLTWCVHVANWAATEAGYGAMRELPPSSLEPELRRELNASPDRRVTLCEMVRRELGKCGDTLELLTK